MLNRRCAGSRHAPNQKSNSSQGGPAHRPRPVPNQAWPKTPRSAMDASQWPQSSGRTSQLSRHQPNHTTFPSLSFIVTAAAAFSNWRPPGKHFGSRPLRANKPNGCWQGRNTIHDLETELGHERLAKDQVTQRARCRAAEGRESTHCCSGRVGSRACAACSGRTRARPSGRRQSDCGTAPATKDSGQSCAATFCAASHQPSAAAPPRSASKGSAAASFGDNGRFV